MTINAPDDPRSEAVQIHADRDGVKHLGNWTTARSFEVIARSGSVELDLRSVNIPEGEIEVTADLDRSVLKLLVEQDANIDGSGLQLAGLARVKDAYGQGAPGGRVIRLSGQGKSSEVRVYRGGVAVLKAMFSREYIGDLGRAHREGTMPAVDDPTREGRAEQ
jgi:hypothetical protein